MNDNKLKRNVIVSILFISLLALILYNFSPSLEKISNTCGIGMGNSNVNVRELSTNTRSSNPSTKILNYFGGHHCPHSRVNSPMYNLINDKFKEKYPDVTVNIYWSSEHDNIFNEYNVEYVPTILNNVGSQVKAVLPEGIVRDNKTDDELEDILLENINSQL